MSKIDELFENDLEITNLSRNELRKTLGGEASGCGWLEIDGKMCINIEAKWCIDVELVECFAYEVNGCKKDEVFITPL